MASSAAKGSATTGSTAAPVRRGVLQARRRADEVKVLLADDDLGTRRGVLLALEEAGLVVCAQADDVETAVESATRERPDLCVVGLNLSGGGGLRAAARIRSKVPDTAVVMLADEVSDDDLFDALRVGVSGFLLKGMNHSRLPHALRAVLRGEAALPRRLVARLMQEFQERDRRRHLSVAEGQSVGLTNREWDVIDLLARGLSTRVISDRLEISQVTVRRHIGSIVKKLHVEDRAAALAILNERSST